MPLAFLSALAAVINSPIRCEDNLRRHSKTQACEIIRIGQNMAEAERLLSASGFKLEYEEPVTPTVNRDYLQQLVIVGDAQPNLFESLAYSWQFSWMPFTHSESPYIVIDADLDGTITEIR